MRPIRNNQAGQTLIDVMVSLALLALALAAATSLAITGARAASESGRRSQASQLASREFEGLKAYRDTQLAKGIAWNTIFATGCSTFIMQNSADEWRKTPSATLTPYRDVDDSGYEANYNAFSRQVTACDAGGSTGIAGPRAPQTVKNLGSDQMKKVTVTVRWQEADGVDRDVVFTSVLANQKQ